METRLFGIYNLGNSGGSWLQDVIDSHPQCHCWEEPRRHLKLPKPGEGGMTGKFIQARIRTFFVEQAESGRWGSVGLIKGFGDKIGEYIVDGDGRFLQLVRNPIRHLHGTRKRAKGATNGLGRPPGDDHEYFLGRAMWQSRRYEKYLRRADTMPLIKLESLSASLLLGGGYFKQVMEYITQLEWTWEQVKHVRHRVFPRHRKAVGNTMLAWGIWWEENPDLPWEKRVDPPSTEIWQHWTERERTVFTGLYERIMLTLGYAIPEWGANVPWGT